MASLYLQRAELADAEALALAYANSANDLAPWSYPPTDINSYITGQYVYLLRSQAGANLLAAFSISGLVRGCFQSAYLGYNAFTPHQGKGYMREGMTLLLRKAFHELKLHRLEANIQPGNFRSIKLVERAGFIKEGYSPQYLQVGGEWKDHERWAILNNLWNAD